MCHSKVYAEHIFAYFLQVIASYFPLAQCIEGLKLLVESLFGATFHRIPLAPGESWHPDVLKMSLHHPEEVHAWVLWDSCVDCCMRCRGSLCARVDLIDSMDM